MEGFLIHDGLLNDRGFGLVLRLAAMTDTNLLDLRGGTTREF
jgi:hypothetical protein